MIAVFALTAIYIVFTWLVFFRFRLLKLRPTYGIVSGFVLLHLIFVPLVGLRFTAPYSEDLRVVQHTIQLTPRLNEPTLVTDVLVAQNVPIKKGTPIFKFDDRIFKARVDQAQAALAEAKQNVLILKADVEVATFSVVQATAELTYAQDQRTRFAGLAAKGAGSTEDAQRWKTEEEAAAAALSIAKANLTRAQLAYDSQIGGVNTTVAQAQANLAQQQFYLDQTTLVAPEDGMIVNLQVRPGMVAGDVRLGAIASFVVDADSYILATYRPSFLKFVEVGQPVEFALDLYPGQTFNGTVQEFLWANGNGQFLPSGTLPNFETPVEDSARFAIRIKPDADVSVRLPIGAQGASIVLAGSGAFADLGKIGLRAYTWLNWVRPIPF